MKSIAQNNQGVPENISKRNFLNKLPKSVIKNGKVINIREGIDELLTKKQDEMITQGDTQYIKTHVLESDTTEVTTLKIETESGKIILRLKYDDSFKTLRNYLDPLLKKEKEVEYELRTAFPPKLYSYFNQTLRSVGLIPNATLFVKKISIGT